MCAFTTVKVEKNIHQYNNMANSYLVTMTIKGRKYSKHVYGSLDEARLIREQMRINPDLLERMLPDRAVDSHGTKAFASRRREARRSAVWTLNEAVTSTVRECWQGTKAETSATANARQAEAFFGSRTRLDAITVDAVYGYIEHLRGKMKNSTSTINRKLAALSKVLSHAYSRDKVARKISMPHLKEPSNRIRFITEEEEEAMFKVMSERHFPETFQDAVRVLLYTGFRLGELWKLECRDIDFGKNTMTIWDTKNSRPRTIPIASKILTTVTRRFKVCGGHGRLFGSVSSTRIAGNLWAERLWAKLREAMGLKEDSQFVLHCLRHTCCTRLVKGGVSMPVVKAWMGHSCIATTMRYAHFAPVDLEQASKVL